MNKELIALMVTTVLLVVLGLGSMTAIVILRPADNNAVILKEIAEFLGPTILIFISLFKNIQNGVTNDKIAATTNRVEFKVDGNIEKLVNQHATVATLTEQLVSVKAAADLAAKTAIDTAAALAAKKE